MAPNHRAHSVHLVSPASWTKKGHSSSSRRTHDCGRDQESWRHPSSHALDPGWPVDAGVREGRLYRRTAARGSRDQVAAWQQLRSRRGRQESGAHGLARPESAAAVRRQRLGELGEEQHHLTGDRLVGRAHRSDRRGEADTSAPLEAVPNDWSPRPGTLLPRAPAPPT